MRYSIFILLGLLFFIIFYYFPNNQEHVPNKKHKISKNITRPNITNDKKPLSGKKKSTHKNTDKKTITMAAQPETKKNGCALTNIKIQDGKRHWTVMSCPEGFQPTKNKTITNTEKTPVFVYAPNTDSVGQVESLRLKLCNNYDNQFINFLSTKYSLKKQKEYKSIRVIYYDLPSGCTEFESCANIIEIFKTESCILNANFVVHDLHMRYLPR